MELNMKSLFYLIGLLMATLVAVAISIISRMPSRYLFSLLFGALTFLIFVLIQNDVGPKRVNLRAKFAFKLSQEFFVLVVYAVSIIIVLLVPSDSGSQFVSWLSIPVINYVRLLAGLLLSSILPGYGLLRLIDRKRRFNGLASLVFSFFISVFLMALASFAAIFASVPISDIYWVTLTLNLAIFAGFSLTFLKKHEVAPDERNRSSASYRIDYLIIACILLFFVIGWIVYYSSYQLGSTGDMWEHYYIFSHVSKGALFSSSHLSYLGPETWFSLHYLALFELTGFPSLNGWMIYAFINFFYVLGFYLMVRELVGDKHPRVPPIATVMATIFAGFGWIVALLIESNSNWFTALNLTSNPDWFSVLTAAGSATYNDIVYSFLYGPIPMFFSLGVLFSLIYLMVHRSRFSFISAFLTVALVVQGFLVHSPEIIMFFVFYFCFLFFVDRKEFGRLKRFSISILIGLITILVIGFPFPSHFYWGAEQSLIFVFLAIGATFFLIKLRSKSMFTFSFPRRLSIVLLCLVWVLYGLSFLVWNSTLDQDVVGQLGAIGLKPWYMYPITSGILLLLALSGLTVLVAGRNFKLKNAKFLVLALVAFFLIGKTISFVNVTLFFAGYWEKRFYSFMVIPLSILGAFFVAEIIPKFSLVISRKLKMPLARHVLVGLLVSAIILSGVASNVLSLDRLSIASQSDPLAKYSLPELQALDFLRTNTSASATVLGLSTDSTYVNSTDSNYLAYVFSGMNHVTSPYWFTSYPILQFVDITNPELALKMLYSLNVTYVFATKSDLEAQSSGYIANHLLKFLPIVFQNSNVTIYQVPKLNPPSSVSNFTLAVPGEELNNLSNQTFLGASANRTIYLPIDMLAESGFDYSIKIAEDGSLFNSKYIILPSDNGWTAEQINSYLAWVNNGGTLIALNGDGPGAFAKQLSINSVSTESLFVDQAIGKSGTVEVGNLNVNSSLFSGDSEVKVVANYFGKNTMSVPLAFSKQIGKGEILYVNVSPLFDSQGSNSSTNFQKIGNLFGILGLDAPTYKDIADNLRWKYLGYDITSIRDYAIFNGSVQVVSNSTIIPYNQFTVSNLSLANVIGTINGSPIHNSITLQNVTISGLLEDGAVHSVIESQNSQNFTIVPSNYGRYSCLLLGNATNISMQVPEEGITFAAISGENDKFNIKLESGTISVENITIPSGAANPTTFGDITVSGIGIENKMFVFTYVPSVTVIPSVTVNETAIFPEAYFPSYINGIVGDLVTFNGTIHFNYDCSSDNAIVMTNFSYSGIPYSGHQTPQINMLDWEIINIRWYSILTSPLFIFCSGLTVLIVFLVHKRLKIDKIK
jgi:hypothetical protein